MKTLSVLRTKTSAQYFVIESTINSVPGAKLSEFPT